MFTERFIELGGRAQKTSARKGGEGGKAKTDKCGSGGKEVEPKVDLQLDNIPSNK